MSDPAACIAVLDMGKSNVKLSAVTSEGSVLQTIATPNVVHDGPPWRHNDLAGISDWALLELAGLCREHPIRHVIATGYGSSGVLVRNDPGEPSGGVALPMIDYEQPLPDDVAAAYPAEAGTFLDRGSAIMQASTHQARQLLWMEMREPAALAVAQWFLGLPQYWAWHFSGVARSEFSTLGAQSHLWNVVDRRFSPIVARHGWQRLIPPFAHAGAVLGPLRPALARRYGLPEGLSVHTGAHDSSANLYRYHAADIFDCCLVSTGTWIVALCSSVDPARLDEVRNMTLNSDMEGRPVGGALSMGGREFAAIAGDQEPDAKANMAQAAALVSRETYALPAFGADSGQFPGSAGKGRIVGPPPASREERLALAVLNVALLTRTCVDCLAPQQSIILDGSYLSDPAYGSLVAQLRPDVSVRTMRDCHGIAAGAALLCGHDTRRHPVALDFETPAQTTPIPGLEAYAKRWYDLSNRQH
ncbi:MAG: FGGY family carbohydrate kinase [Aestuariivirga sp.]